MTCTTTRSMSGYQTGRLVIRKDGDRFIMVGDVYTSNNGGDHFQLIYEALEIAARSGDAFAADFAAMRDELLAASADWGT